jgi:hypothetical protein
MLKLIENCSHGNEVATFYFEKNKEKNIIKSSSCQTGIEQIKQEFKGWNWYQSKRYPNSKTNLCKIIKSNENYIKIKIQYIEGCKEKYSKGIQKNSVLINTIIKHYCNIWQGYKKNRFPLHGDLSIGNVITNKDGTHIIDWEHFSLGGSPFGFDAYNLLFEQLWFSMKGRKRPKRSELDILLDNIKLLRSSTESHFFYDQPLFSVQRFIKTNSIYWKNKIHRLPVLNFKEEHAMIIDKMIRLHI